MEGVYMASLQGINNNNQVMPYRDEHLVMDFALQSAALDAERMVLTRKEYDLLSLLVQHAGEIIPREALLMQVWGYGSEIRTRTLDVHIRRLRKKLGAVVFSDPVARRDLEAIIHPFVREATDRWFASLSPHHPFAVADIPLLFEAGRDVDFDAIIVAACAPETELRRLIARDGLNEAEARLRIAAQLPLDQKIGKADYVIHTDGSFAETDRQVGEGVSQLRNH